MAWHHQRDASWMFHGVLPQEPQKHVMGSLGFFETGDIPFFCSGCEMKVRHVASAFVARTGAVIVPWNLHCFLFPSAGVYTIFPADKRDT